MSLVKRHNTALVHKTGDMVLRMGAMDGVPLLLVHSTGINGIASCGSTD